MWGTVTLLISNVLLSAYPLLIKMNIQNVSVVMQVILRMVVYICITVPVLVLGGQGWSMMASLVNVKYLVISAVNLLHIYTSYRGFTLLPAGVALTTFYVYPIVQVLLAHVFLGAPVTLAMMANLVGCLMGVFVLNARSVLLQQGQGVGVGLAFIAVAAVTEAVIGVFYKKMDFANPFFSLFTLYAPVGIWCVVLYYYYYYHYHNYYNASSSSADAQQQQQQQQQSRVSWSKIVLFNFLIGGVGYLLRLFALTQVSIAWFSGLLFTSAVSAFGLGWWFLREQVRPEHWAGTALIFYNIFRLHQHI